MTTLLPILLLGFLILIFCVRIIRRSVRNDELRAVTTDEYFRAAEALDSWMTESQAITRILSSEDLEFIRASAPPEMQRIFERERKKLALKWLRHVQKQIASLMDLHLRLAGGTFDPAPRVELELGVKYAAFRLVSNMVLSMIWLRGPFKATRIMGYTVRKAGYICDVFKTRLEAAKRVDVYPGQDH
jgi:hypothetical protein